MSRATPSASMSSVTRMRKGTGRVEAGYGQAVAPSGHGQPIGSRFDEGHIRVHGHHLAQRASRRCRFPRLHPCRSRTLLCGEPAPSGDRTILAHASWTETRVSPRGGGPGTVSGLRWRRPHRRGVRGGCGRRNQRRPPQGSGGRYEISIIPSLTSTDAPPTRTAVRLPPSTSASTSRILGRPISNPCSTRHVSNVSRRGSRAAR